MIKLGTLKDFANAKKQIREAGFAPEIIKSEGDLIREIMVEGKTVVSIARLNERQWIFRYNKEFWEEKTAKSS